MAPLRASTTKSEWLPDDPTAFVPTRLWKLPFITTWDDSQNQNHPTDSAEEAQNHLVPVPPRQRSAPDSGSSPALQFRRLYTAQEHRRTCPSESSPSSTAGFRRQSPQLRHGTTARCSR